MPSNHFAATGASTPIYGFLRHPGGFHDAAAGKTWICWEAWHSETRHVQAITHDHAAGEWSSIVDVALAPLVNDSHGLPSIVKDDDGYVHIFHGPHVGDLLMETTVSAGDPSQWYRQRTFAGKYTYSHPLVVGGALYLFTRETISASNAMPLVLFKTTSLAGGGATFGVKQTLIDFGSDSRVDAGLFVANGAGIHFLAFFTNYADTNRKHIYHFVYDTTSGNISNADGSTVVAPGNFPISLATANAGFRVVDTQTDNTDGPGFAIDSNGNLHIVYARGSSSPYSLFHTIFDGTSWSVPAAIGAITGMSRGKFTDSIALAPLPGGELELWYPNGGSFNHGGNMMRRIYSSGAWGSEATILAAGSKALARAGPIRDAHANARILFSEVNQNDLDTGAGGLKLFVHGAGGFLQKEEQQVVTDSDLLIDGTQPGSGTDASYASVSLLIDGA